ncbi:MAG: hypothetical protein RSB87_04255 [Clostridia bacterium]
MKTNKLSIYKILLVTLFVSIATSLCGVFANSRYIGGDLSFSMGVPGFNGSSYSEWRTKQTHGKRQRLDNVSISPSHDHLDARVKVIAAVGEVAGCAWREIANNGSYELEPGSNNLSLQGGSDYRLQLSSKLHYISTTNCSGIYKVN